MGATFEHREHADHTNCGDAIRKVNLEVLQSAYLRKVVQFSTGSKVCGFTSGALVMGIPIVTEEIMRPRDSRVSHWSC
jgi:hypothetical protein